MSHSCQHISTVKRSGLDIAVSIREKRPPVTKTILKPQCLQELCVYNSFDFTPDLHPFSTVYLFQGCGGARAYPSRLRLYPH